MKPDVGELTAAIERLAEPGERGDARRGRPGDAARSCAGSGPSTTTAELIERRGLAVRA